MKNNSVNKFILFCAILFLTFAACILYCIESFAQIKPIPGIEGYFTTTSVNMRKGPGTKYEVYKVLPKGYLLDVINDQDPTGYIEVWEDENVYFVYKDYTEVRFPTKEELEK